MSAHDPPPLAARLRVLRHTLLQLVAELQITAERAAQFAARRKPRLSGTPQLEGHRECLARWYEQAVAALSRQNEPGGVTLYDLLATSDERPPRPVIGAAYAFEAVVKMAGFVRQIGWGNGPSLLRDARDPWHCRTPAQRLSGPDRWVWMDVSLPHFGDPAVVAEFTAAITCEFGRAERAVGECGTTSGQAGRSDIGRQAWAVGGERIAGRSGRTLSLPPPRRRVSKQVMEDTFAVFKPGETLRRADVIRKMRQAGTEVDAGQTSRALTALAEDGKLTPAGKGKYTCS